MRVWREGRCEGVRGGRCEGVKEGGGGSVKGKEVEGRGGGGVASAEGVKKTRMVYTHIAISRPVVGHIKGINAQYKGYTKLNGEFRGM